MRISVVIASAGRPEFLAPLASRLAQQTEPPVRIVFSVPGPEHAPAQETLSAAAAGTRVELICSPRGASHQRNTGIERVIGDSDVIAFFDDDYVPSRYALEGLRLAFEAFPEANGVSGRLLADGINGPGLSIAEATAMVEAHDAAGPPAPPRQFRRLEGLYGCNMAFRVSAIGATRFDERLPLYAWQEDIDFSARVGGVMLRVESMVGAHCGAKSGREKSGLLLGYSQIANPIYLVRKGSMSLQLAARHCTRNFLANHLKALKPEPWVDRLGRLRGNWIAIYDIAHGRISPERIVKLREINRSNPKQHAR